MARNGVDTVGNVWTDCVNPRTTDSHDLVLHIPFFVRKPVFIGFLVAGVFCKFLSMVHVLPTFLSL